MILDRILTAAYDAEMAALAGFTCWLAAAGLREAWRQIRFRRGPVPDDGPRLNFGESRALYGIRKHYRRWAPEPAYREMEDR